MHARSITPGSAEIISNLSAAVESIIIEFQQIKLSTADTGDVNSLEKLEIELHEKSTRLADLVFVSALNHRVTVNII